jgi:predicted MPP superfamily phosphohydrolase
LAQEFDGYRLVQIGDIHLDDWTRPQRLHRIVEMVNEQRPDLVAITGDFASYSARRLDEELLVGALRRLSARDGVISILGNHDYLTDVNLVRRCVREGGVKELLNDVRTLRRGAARLHVAGIDDVMEGRSRLDLVLGRLPEEGAAILLAHEPDFADVAAATGRFDLQLSGHSHGGQVRVPLLTRIVLPPFSQRYPRGLHRVGAWPSTPTGASAPSTPGCAFCAGRRSRSSPSARPDRRGPTDLPVVADKAASPAGTETGRLGVEWRVMGRLEHGRCG